MMFKSADVPYAHHRGIDYKMDQKQAKAKRYYYQLNFEIQKLHLYILVQ